MAYRILPKYIICSIFPENTWNTKDTYERYLHIRAHRLETLNINHYDKYPSPERRKRNLNGL